MVLAGAYLFPKYDARIVIFGFFLFIDISCWSVFKNYLSKKSKWSRYLLSIAYWLPFLLFILLLAGSLVLQLPDWPPFFRIYLPGALVIAFQWKFLLLIFLILGELVALPVNIFRHRNKKKDNHITDRFRIPGFITAGLLAGTFTGLLIFSGFFFWVYDFKVRTLEIKVKNLPADLDGFRMVQLSDIHLGSWISHKPFLRAVEMVNAQHPDVILFTGDLVNFATREAYPFENDLRKLKAPLGIFAILGNHDYGDYLHWDTQAAHDQNNKDLESFYQKLGWKLLKNEHSIVYKGEDSLAILGVENWSANKMWGQKGDLKKADSGIDLVQTKILLSHDPTHWDKEVLPMYPDILLTLSGHTHAMQMGWEIGDWRWSPAKFIFPRWAGLYTMENIDGIQFLNVNRGLGHLGFPGRIGIRPEITVIILKQGS
jgi:uncharacterized protein